MLYHQNGKNELFTTSSQINPLSLPASMFFFCSFEECDSNSMHFPFNKPLQGIIRRQKKPSIFRSLLLHLFFFFFFLVSQEMKIENTAQQFMKKKKNCVPLHQNGTMQDEIWENKLHSKSYVGTPLQVNGRNTRCFGSISHTQHPQIPP